MMYYRYTLFCLEADNCATPCPKRPTPDDMVLARAAMMPVGFESNVATCKDYERKAE